MADSILSLADIVATDPRSIVTSWRSMEAQCIYIVYTLPQDHACYCYTGTVQALLVMKLLIPILFLLAQGSPLPAGPNVDANKDKIIVRHH